MNKEKIAAIIVTYYPTSQVSDNILAISEDVDLTIVIDNTPNQNNFIELNNDKILIVNNKDNIGLAKALNIGMSIAEQNSFENIFLFDQDTELPPNYFDSMLLFKKQKNNLRSDLWAAYVPNFLDINCMTYGRFPLISKYHFKHAQCPEMCIDYQKYAVIAITSGTLILVSKYKVIGPFRSDYFIDFIDNEYCLRIKEKGFNCAINCSITINHRIGKRTKKKLFGFEIKPNNHKPIRRYYIGKNGIKTAKKYIIKFPSYSVLITLRMIHEFISILLFENLKKQKISKLIIGILHGFSVNKKY